MVGKWNDESQGYIRLPFSSKCSFGSVKICKPQGSTVRLLPDA